MSADSLKDPGMHYDTDNALIPLASGHRPVGVPGVVAGMEAALERYGSGKFTLGELITNSEDSSPPYAYELARDGFTISPELTFWLFWEQNRLQYYPATREIYAIGTGPSHPGDTLVQADYPRSLLFIAEHGADAFYEDTRFSDPATGLPRNSLARMIAADMAAAEGNAKTNPVLLGNEPRWGGASNDKGFLTVDDFNAYGAGLADPADIDVPGPPGHHDAAPHLGRDRHDRDPEPAGGVPAGLQRAGHLARGER